MESLKGLGVIFHYLKKYWVTLIIVTIFILATTYFQVKTPQMLGESIDNLATYVTTAKEREVIKSIEDGNGLPQDIRETLQTTADKEENEQLDALLDMSNEDLQKEYEVDKELVNIIDIDPNYDNEILSDTAKINEINSDEDLTDEEKDIAKLPILNTSIYVDGVWTDEQITAISESDILTDEMKSVLLYAPSDSIKDFLEKLSYKEITDAMVTEEYDTFVGAIVWFAIAVVLLSLSNYIYMRFMVKASANTSRDIRNDLFGKIEKLSIRFFDVTPDGDLLSRFINDIDNVSNAMNQSFTQAAAQIFTLVAIIFMMFNADETVVNVTLNGGVYEIHNILTWSMLSLGIIAILVACVLVKLAQKNITIQQEKLGDLNGYIDEQVQGQRVNISYGLEERSINGMLPYNEEFRKTSVNGQIYAGLLMPVISGIGYINLAMLIFMGSIFIINGSSVITIGLLIAFINYSQRFFQPLAQMFSQYNLIELGLTGANRIKSVLDEEPEIVNSENAKEINGINGNVVLKDVNFSYNPGTPILNNINIEVDKGQMVALVGPTGSGKTTVMNLMNRFYDIDSGEILYDGINIKDITLDSLRRNVGIVLQESVIFSGSIADNIRYGKDDATLEEVIEAAKNANLHEFISSLDDGYETQVDNNTSIFSTGQKQLLSIARTIITDPDLLILDEATSNVDTVTEEKIQVAINNVLKNRTSFVIAHRLKTILDADIIVVLKDGNILEKGSHKELMELDGFYAELYKNQFVNS